LPATARAAVPDGVSAVVGGTNRQPLCVAWQ
jgi:hypothetical protein